MAKQGYNSLLKKKAVVITGASTGIGKSCALLLDRLGYKVFAGIRKASDAEALKKEASDALVPLKIDVTDIGSIEAAAKIVRDTTEGELFALVNNAGISGNSGPLECAPISGIRKVFEVNAIGVFMMVRTFLPMLRKSQGRIVNVTSMVSLLPIPGLSSYSASKFAVEGLSESLRVELLPLGVSVSIVNPGPVDTPMFEKGRADLDEGLKAIDPKIREPYFPLIAYLQNKMKAPKGIPAEKVAQAIMHAVSSKTPKHRYVVGREAKIMAKIGKLPTVLRDRLLARMIFGRC